jgi:hypothetical protein
MHMLGEHKKLLYAAVLVLVEKSLDIDLVSNLTKIVRGWLGGADTAAAGA